MDQTNAVPISPSSKRSLFLKTSAIGVTQIIGWGATFQLPGVLGKSIAQSLDLSLTIILAGPTVMLVTLAFVAYALTSYFERFGARPIMLCGTVIAAIGLGLLSLAQNQATYFLAWFLIGVSGAGILTTSAQIAIAEFAGRGAKQAIGMLALFGGTSASIFWPVSEVLENQFGWRITTAIFASLFVLVCLPLVNWAVPPHQSITGTSLNTDQPVLATTFNRTDFVLMAGAIAANGFVTWGFSLTLIELFEDKGLDRTDAVALASLLGIVGLAARTIDFVGGSRWSGLTTGVVASVVLPCSFLMLMGGTGRTIVIVFLLLYGLASGAMSVARSTIPLAVFPPGSFARASSRLALPLNLSYAAAPPAFSAILIHGNASSALVLATVLSMIALFALATLAIRHRNSGQPKVS